MRYVGEDVQYQYHCTKDAAKQELHNVQRNNTNINEYSMNIKGLLSSLSSIEAPIDDNLVSMA